MSKSTSFRRATMSRQVRLPPATRLSTHKAQALISTGVPSLDDILGGGLPVGSILLIEEDRQSEYSRILFSYFISQGIAATHKVCIASAEMGDIKSTLLPKLPGWGGERQGHVSNNNDESGAKAGSPAKDKETGDVRREETDVMKIAWRYKDLPRLSGPSFERPVAISSEEIPFCQKFDLSTRVAKEVLESADLVMIPTDEANPSGSSSSSGGSADGEGEVFDTSYDMLFKKLCDLVEDGFSSLTPPKEPKERRNVLRIGIHSLGSSFWDSKDPHDVLRFLVALKGLLRYSFAACVVTMPAHLHHDHTNEGRGERSTFIRRVEHICDAVVELDSFHGQYIGAKRVAEMTWKGRQEAGNTSGSSSEYHGFIRIHKLPCLNSVVPPASRLSVLVSGSSGMDGGTTSDLAFCLRRRKFTIETYHLPIEGGVGERRVPDNNRSSSGGSDGKLDF